MPKWSPKVIVVAERYRRTLVKPANRDQWCGILGNGEPARKEQTKIRKRSQNPSKIHLKWSRNGCKIDPKCIQNQVCVLGAFWEAFGEPFSPKGRMIWSHFGSHFQEKSEKRPPKNNAKIDGEKVLKMMRKWSGNEAEMNQKRLKKPVFSRKAGLAQMYVLPT